MTAAAPLFWLKRIEDTLNLTRDIPLWGSPPPFPWDACTQKIASLLQWPDLRIEHRSTRLLPAAELSSGLGEDPVDLCLSLTPIATPFHWLISQEDMKKLTQLVLSPEKDSKGFSSQKFQEGFYRYLSLNVIQALDELKAFDKLSLTCATATPLPLEESLCVDIGLIHSSQTIWGRIICPPEFLQEFRTFFGTKSSPLFSSSLSKEMDVDLRVGVGNSTLSLSQWEKLSVGDFITLDRCSYDPHTHKGTVTLTLEKQPLFRARLKEKSLKIVDYAFYYEEDNMTHDSPEDEKDNEPLPEEENDLSLPPSVDEDFSAEENPAESNEPNPELEKMVSTQAIPITVTVEVGRLKMNLEKLLQLKPGNLIELPIRPEHGVDLVVNGKKVAKAELVKLGEVLGVKILQIGE